jgi:hypothetical protein
MQAAVTALWQQTDNAQSFLKAALDQGYMVARGDKCKWAIIDETGAVHNLAKWSGADVAGVDARFKGFDLSQLPTVKQAQDVQKASFAAAERKAWVEDTRKEQRVTACLDTDGHSMPQPCKNQELCTKPNPLKQSPLFCAEYMCIIGA